MAVIYIVLFCLLVYGILFQCYHSWWNSIPAFTATEAENGKPATTISVIIPARNEAQHIAACLHSIGRQSYPRHLLQVIVIDDNSTDDTLRVAESIVYDGLQIICHRLPAAEINTAPKKRAIEKGISMASGTLIVTTDADCTAAPGWLQTIAAYYDWSGHVFIAAPVKIRDSPSVLPKFQALDFLTMQGITGAAVYKQFHHMCNGANLAYEKKVFYEVGGFSGIDAIASGDDMLLMHKVAEKYPTRLGFVKSAAAIVTTQPASSWNAFFQQRIRWASKALHYRQPAIFFVLLLVYLLNLSIACLLVMGFFYPFALLMFVLLCISKFFMELFFVRDVARFFGQTYLLPWLLVLQPLHVLYIVVSGFFGQFKTYTWKGRKLK